MRETESTGRMFQRCSLYRIVCAFVICVVVFLQSVSNVELASVWMTGVKSYNTQWTSTDKNSDSFQRVHQSTSRPFRHSKTKFVFFMGLEGTGHHLVGDILDKSPLKESLADWKVIPTHTVALGQALALEKSRYKIYSGLFNRHCHPAPPKKSEAAIAQMRLFKKVGDDAPHGSNQTALETIGDGDDSRRRLIQRQLTQTSDSITSLKQKLAQNGGGEVTAELLSKLSQQREVGKKDPQFAVIQQLQQMEQIIAKQEDTASTNSSSHVFVPINTWRGHGFGLVGQLSYPNMPGLECRKLNYPNIDLLYNACDVANVDCVHVYLYRDPYAVLKSTIRRGMNTGVIQTIHLYISHLSIMYAQLSRHAPRTVGCFGFLDPIFSSQDPQQNEKHELENNRQERNWNIFRDMLRFKTNEEFESMRNTVFKPPTPISKESKQNMIPSDLQVYMDVLVQLYEDVRELCHGIVEAQGSFDQ